MSSKINKIILVVGVFLFILVVVLGAVYWQNSTKHQMKLLTETIAQKDYEKFHEISPSFNDGKTLNKETFLIFAESFPEKNKENEIRKYTNSKTVFEQMGQDGWFTPTKFVPRPRYLTLETEDNTEATISVGNHLLTTENAKVGPLIGADYSMSYAINSPVYGDLQQDHKAKLTSENQTFTLEEKEAFIADTTFQEKLLNQVVSYYSSMNQGIQNNLDFSEVTGAEDKTKATLQQTFDGLRPYVESVEQTFQEFIMNSESLKIEGSDDEPTAIFDLYTDTSLSVEAKTADKKTEEITNASNNAVVTMQFDQGAEEWLIQSIDFETYTQQPDEWSHTSKITLPDANKARWQEGQKSQGEI
ncbi:hypothetical protein [Tetragenococcus koreensis]|uniref:YvbJ-like NTF2-like domain-containing protein n=1 Tax=Tetragenococcus koreensis TaxID=290335 RepID=A0AAN4UB81_9ENTE|nr:hypothetical protein [Tetragenococcus koreensis]MCF1616855.1 hypothetical protein [Tetragenococcus koreensis]GEQ48707.1 hypothetical protein TK11N_05590 [Tetragenococcus koreensis]GEQ51136.1 hypothetical protein TK12N_04800 [Tetragenococcus koreensis]GEQ53711.1 hypothetical protein TK2N_05550 [Tetragenococcus koreensis]GEQ56137.1 hypothetical protein TK4N_04800 [Tetragenococcus koreensis]